MSDRLNFPIWADADTDSTGFTLQHLVNGSWVDTDMKTCALPAGYTNEVCLSRYIEKDIKSTAPDLNYSGTTGVTPQPDAYQVYRMVIDGVETREMGFINDWSYEEWSGEQRCLSAPINRHADARQHLLYGNFAETGNSIIIKEMIRPDIKMQPNSIAIGAEQYQTVTIVVTSNMDFELILPEWLTASQTAFTSGTTVAYLYPQTNTSFDSRQFTIQAKHDTYWSSDYEYTDLAQVAQAGKVAYLTIYPDPLGVAWDTTGLTSVTVYTNTDFTATTNSSDTWLTYSGKTEVGTNYYNVYFNISANTGDDRQTHAYFEYVVNSSGGTYTRALRIVQAHVPIIEINYNELTITGITHSQVILYSDVSWSVVSSDSWITVSPTSGNNGTTVIDIYCDFSMAAREGNVVFENNAGSQVSLEINQIPGIPANEMWYTSVEEHIVNPAAYSDPWNVNIISNTYNDGYGKIVFDGDLTEIPNRAFENQNFFLSIWLPNSIQKIGNLAFSGTPDYASTKVYYMGTYNDWQSVTIGANAFYKEKTGFRFVTEGYTEVPYVIPKSMLNFGVQWSRSVASNYTSIINLDFIFTGNTISDYGGESTAVNIIRGDGSEVYQWSGIYAPIEFKSTRYRVHLNAGGTDYIRGDIGLRVTGLTPNSITIEEKRITNNLTGEYIATGWTRTAATTAASLNISSKVIGYKNIKLSKTNGTTVLDCIAVLDENGVPGFYDKITNTFITNGTCSVFSP